MQWLYVHAFIDHGAIVDSADIRLGWQYGQLLGWGEAAIQLPKGSYSIWVPYTMVHWGETATLDTVVVDGQWPASLDIYLGDAPVSVECWYRWGY